MWAKGRTLAVAAAALVGGCIHLPLSRVAPGLVAPGGLSLAGSDTVRVVGVTTKANVSWRFDSMPAPRMAGDTIVARACGAPLALRLRSVAALWVARPGELARPIAKADVRHALAVGHAGHGVAPGSRVRLWAPGPGLDAQVATLVHAGDDSIVVVRTPARGAADPKRADTASDRVSLALGSVRRLQRSLGRTRWPGVLTGLKVGAAIGSVGVLATQSYKAPSCNRTVPGNWCSLNDIFFAVSLAAKPLAGAFLGALAGGVVGSLFVTERWEDVPLDMTRSRCAAVSGDPQTP